MESLKETLTSVVISVTDRCNRKCHFCPHGQKFNPLVRDMSIDTAQAISKGLKGFKGRVRFSGSGEPLLNDDILKIVRTLRENLDGEFELITNGDRLNQSLLLALYTAGINKISISLHDAEQQVGVFKDIFKNVDPKAYSFREHWKRQDDFNNRCGHSYSIDETVNRPCYLPFYKMRIDANGDILLCCQDWFKTEIFGNVHLKKPMKIWLSKRLNQYRRKLLKGDRSLFPCSKCDVQGDKYGKESFEEFKKCL